MIDRWPESLRRSFGNRWPSSFTAFDLETSGFNFKLDVVLEFGWCQVKDGQVVDRGHEILDWTKHPIVALPWLEKRLRKTAADLAVKGQTRRFTTAFLAQNGKKPEDVLRRAAEKLQGAPAVVTYNGLYFDAPMLEHNLVGFRVLSDGELSFAGRHWDLALIHKAEVLAKLDPKKLTAPLPGEGLDAYQRRMKAIFAPKGARFRLIDALTRHGVAAQGLTLHHAEDDAVATAKLMAKYGRIYEETYGG